MLRDARHIARRSANPYCEPCKLTDPKKNYDCTTETYVNDTYSCEIGDLTGRLGPIALNSDRAVLPKQVSDRHLPPAQVLEVWECKMRTRGRPGFFAYTRFMIRVVLAMHGCRMPAAT